MNRSRWLAAVLICSLSLPHFRIAAADSAVGGSLLDPRIRSLLYSPQQVIRLHGWVGYHVELEFEPDESFVTLGGGDLSALAYDAIGNHLFLKPRATVIRTNLTVITNKRTYVIDYTAQSGRPDPLTDELVYSLRFNYPPNAQTTPSESITHALEGATNARYQNLDYWYCGDPLLQPVAASDDGVHTRLRFGPAAEIPAIFVRTEDGTESLLNFSMEGPDLVIHRLARHLVLRRGKQVGCLTNKGFIGSGERLDTGTVSPRIHRHTRQIAP